MRSVDISSYYGDTIYHTPLPAIGEAVHRLARSHRV